MLLARPSRSDLLTVAAYWPVATAVILPTYWQQFAGPRAMAGMVYTVVLDSAAVFAIVFGLLPNLLTPRYRLRALGLLLVFLLASGLLYNYGYSLILNQLVPVSPLQLVHSIIRHAFSYGMLAVLLTGKRYFDVQQRLILAQKAHAESELRNLKAQIDPHFLFNNLNVLRGLIQHDPVAADEYLTHFAELYRYLIRHKDEDFVSLTDELRFADEYVYLLRHRFGTAYCFRQQLPEPAALGQLLVVPGTLQLLLENAIKHNAGDDEDPLIITIEASETHLTVRHPRRPKRTAVDSTGTGLANLRERYLLLTGQAITVQGAGPEFVVTVPLLAMAQPAGKLPQPENTVADANSRSTRL
ncbi:sensor histidine kinase [Hymenobacter cellulosivorans]|uniref:Sensor histidine kinase n=1 Tax=Hymenobacter cellulosivorans TaxID=2932249 RepID=A0ABY4FBK7_9BACT|nr:sensor histidine kinase [Hymenobacter cellulosivorans]UOQ53324.1 sensor histidine kinase [Hymenobacter cellulosivorans]